MEVASPWTGNPKITGKSLLAFADQDRRRIPSLKEFSTPGKMVCF
jgi:hypothetical protein